MPTDPSWSESGSSRSRNDEEASIFGGLCDMISYEASDVLQSYRENPPASIPLSRYDHDFASDTDGSESPWADDRMEGHDRFEGIGKWPRRLLHVPSMTSMEWQPGDRYGEHVAPRYNAVSYTWGRYDLDFPGAKKMRKYRHIKSIEIKGIDWPVPRISPEHFSVDQFRRLIWRTCEPVDKTEGKVDFLWLDVACIDQNHGPQKLAEIGRQAAIFHGAHRVFIWLTKLGGERLSHIVKNLLQSARRYISTHILLIERHILGTKADT